MIRSTAFITCSAAFALAVPNAVSAAVPVTPSQSTRSPSATMSTLAVRAKISASLSKTSFEASEVGSVKLSYRFSKRSKHFRYRLSVKNGASWQTVNMVKKTGRFKGSHTVTVKKFFAGEPVKVGSYRLRLTADGGSTTLAFSVTSAPPAVVKPETGLWHSTGMIGPYRCVGGDFSDSIEVTQLYFEVASDRVNLSKLGFTYTYWGPSFPFTKELCSGSASSVKSSLSPITNGQVSFSDLSGGEVFRFQGMFDSPTTAHGTAQFGTTVTDFRCSLHTQPVTGTFSWTATRQ